MNDETRNTIEPDEPADRGVDRSDGSSAEEAEILADRGMPAIGRYRGGRSRAWWLTPLVVILAAGGGAVWTIHTFVARHDEEAKAHRNAVAETSAGGRMFKDAPADGKVASAPPTASAPLPISVPNRTPVVVYPSAPNQHSNPVRSYYDAPLLSTGSTSSADGRTGNSTGTVAASGIPGELGGAASSLAATVPLWSVGVSSQNETGTIAKALTPSSTPRVRAGMLGNRSLILAQGAKIDCAGDTAFDSTQAGLSTCTVTRNVYSDNGRVVLIERGSQINSQYRSNVSPGQKRALILAARIETPQGVTVEIDSPAADALGRMGIDGYVDNHWKARIGAAMMLGLTQDAIGYLSTRGGNDTGSVVYENTQQQGNDMATRVLDSTINIPPTLTQKQGAEFSIVVARDLDFGTVYALQAERAP